MAAALAFTLAACSGHQSAPTAPTSSTPGAAGAPATGGATIAGTVVTGSTSTGAWAGRAAGLSVSVANTNISSSVDGSGSFMLQNVPAGRVDLQFSGPGVDAQLTLDDVAEHATVHITVHVNGNTATVDDSDAETPDGGVEVEGRIDAMTTSPKTIKVNGKTISVTIDTTIRHGDTTLTFSDLHVGDLVHVKGTSSGATSTTITATEIMLQTSNGNPDPGNGGPDDGNGDDNGGGGNTTNVDISGTVSGKTGTCPNLTFTVSSTTVKTNASTQFQHTTCSTLANADRVEVQGTKQSDNSLLASRVEKNN